MARTTSAVPSGVKATVVEMAPSLVPGTTGPMTRSPPEPSALATASWTESPDPSRVYAMSDPSGE